MNYYLQSRVIERGKPIGPARTEAAEIDAGLPDKTARTLPSRAAPQIVDFSMFIAAGPPRPSRVASSSKPTHNVSIRAKRRPASKSIKTVHATRWPRTAPRRVSHRFSTVSFELRVLYALDEKYSMNACADR